ncbi:hypothetical protein GYMLUDRAFT_341764 [Collybiopsis luxurians FD-317 M1]|nr:hypothetical protein GYMLUDRAFT_341764 [Collybiopsis luxurians FD-317 M1]
MGAGVGEVRFIWQVACSDKKSAVKFQWFYEESLSALNVSALSISSNSTQRIFMCCLPSPFPASVKPVSAYALFKLQPHFESIISIFALPDLCQLGALGERSCRPY